MHAALIAAAEAAEHTNELPFPPVVFGVGAFVGLVAHAAHHVRLPERRDAPLTDGPEGTEQMTERPRALAGRAWG